MKPPTPGDLALSSIAAAGMIAVALIAVIGWRRRAKASWASFGIGALAWTIGVALKFAWAVPANKRVLAFLASHLGRLGAPASWLYIGLLTGVFEVGATWLLVRTTRVRRASRADATGFGIGFGAVEAALLGMVSFAVVAVIALFWSHLPLEAQKALASHGGRWTFLIPIFERAYTIVAHAVSCILVVEAVQQRRARWFVASFVYKTLVDGIAAWGIMAWDVRSNLAHIVWFELLLCAFVLAWVPLVRLARRAPPGSGPIAATPLAAVAA